MESGNEFLLVRLFELHCAHQAAREERIGLVSAVQEVME